jgi:tetracycline repressor-like protein
MLLSRTAVVFLFLRRHNVGHSGLAGGLGLLGSLSGASLFNPPYWINWAHLSFGVFVYVLTFGLNKEDFMNAQNTHQQILDAAQRLIEAGGFTRLTTSEIAREAGCAEGTIFKHFKRKDENLEDIALAAIRFSDKLIPLAAALFADANLSARHRQAMNESGRGPKDAFKPARS